MGSLLNLFYVKQNKKRKFIDFRKVFTGIFKRAEAKKADEEKNEYEENIESHDPLRDLVQSKYDELGPYTYD